MTRREYLERKLEKRAEWAVSRDAKSEAAFRRFRSIGDGIPMGQPILVGHHSEKHHRRDIARMDSALQAASESSKMADLHRSKAAGLEAQLDGSIFSDDPDAVEAITARIAELEATREHMKLVNAAYKKAPGADPAARLAAMVRTGTLTEAEAMKIARFWALCPYHAGKCHPSYELSNLGGNIGRLRKRLVDVAARAERMEKAETAGVLIEGTGEYVRVTFPEKPSRDVLNALREAGYRWGGGSWTGRRDALPASVATR